MQRGGAGGRARRARGQEGKRARGQERCRNALFIGLPGSKNSEVCLVYRGLTDRSVALAFPGDKKNTAPGKSGAVFLWVFYLRV